MMSRAALAILIVFLVSAVAEAKNYRKFNSPTWGGRWKQILKAKDINYVHPYVGAK